MKTCKFSFKENMNNIITKSMLTLTISSAAILSGCAGSSITDGEARAVVGAVIGSTIGGEFGKGNGRKVTKLLGAAVGGYLGATLGRDLDSVDQSHVTTALNNTPDNRQVRWNNSNTGAQYAFTPSQSYESTVNQQPTQCRNYTMLVDMGGSPERVQGRACMVNGQWVNA